MTDSAANWLSNNDGQDETAAAAQTNTLLSRRELDVMRLLIEGMTDKEIGVGLDISPLTASTHVKRILKKMEVSTRTAAIAKALRGNMIPDL